MKCTHCGLCCEETEMLLTNADITALEKLGYPTRSFVHFSKKGTAQLRNNRGTCVFYNTEERRCKVYKLRPLGCRIYPVIYSEEEGIVRDDLCPEKSTVSEKEEERKCKQLLKLLKKIDRETRQRIPIT
jgi:Fe-S-cluster containining protein